MKIEITKEPIANIFCNIFSPLKQFGECLRIYFKPDNVYIQGMDQGHVLLYEITLNKDWFSNYDVTEETVIGVNSTIFSQILDIRETGQQLIISDNKTDKLTIAFINPVTNVKKAINVGLVDIDDDLLNIPDMEGQSVFSLKTKIFSDMISQLNIFSTEVAFICTEEKINLTAHGIEGEMDVNIPIDYLEEFAIDEDTTVDIKFGVNYMKKITSFSKLSTIVTVELSDNYPMKVTYELGEDSNVKFYLAPKIDDDDDDE